MTENLNALADRVEALADLTCPLCGENGFDAPGISQHWSRWCEVERVIGSSHNNSDVAAALRARATAA
jgi:hypothetical protein